MNNIYKLYVWDVENEKDTVFIKTDLGVEDFEKVLVKLNKKSLKNDTIVSRYAHFQNIVSMLEDAGCERVLLYNNFEYEMQDRCPIPNSTKWVKHKKTETELNPSTS